MVIAVTPENYYEIYGGAFPSVQFDTSLLPKGFFDFLSCRISPEYGRNQFIRAAIGFSDGSRYFISIDGIFTDGKSYYRYKDHADFLTVIDALTDISGADPFYGDRDPLKEQPGECL